MGLLTKAENVADRTDGDASQPALRKVKVSKKNLGVLKKKISEYQKMYRVFGCILLENRSREKGKVDFFEELTKMTGEIGITSPLDQDHALILLPSELDRELIAHRLSRSLNAEPVLSFRAASPEYVITRINSMS